MNHRKSAKNSQSDKAQPDRNSNPIFGALSDFGLDSAGSAQVFGAAEEPAPVGPNIAQTHTLKEIELGIYSKSFKCPACDADSKVPAVRSSHIRLTRSDTDFMPIYKDPNPLYYFAVFCTHCGYAAIASSIKKLSAAQKKLFHEKIGSSWKFDKKYPVYYDPQTAIEIHKLALYNAVVSGEKEGVKSILSLHIGWLYRILEDIENEMVFLRTAREGFERTFANEPAPVGGLDASSMQYLIGELSRRVGDYSGALNWFKLVLVDRNAKQRVKDLALEQKDRIMAYYASGGKFK
ncbi:MAG: DUF2225 domain-containing protein [Oscillospiraceae bacterium]|nr:DUF2225 domain-containing protein [Oscillospiraceae bacterium]